MSLKIYNTLSKKKEDFVPLNAPKVGMYVCGVTVYDESHVGHARVYTAFDVVARYLRYKGYDLTYVRNFTDVDDKIIKRGNERGQSAREVSDQYIEAFHRDMGLLGIAPVEIEPRVSEHIGQIIDMVQKLIDNGVAYVGEASEGEEGRDVYYAVRAFANYGRLSGRDIDEMRSGARVQVDDRKKDPLDFALWKAAKPGEPKWDSPWGAGRPGWHIECSAMSTHYLGATLDIHGGGKDLIFPHHENEIAQSEASTGQTFVRTWMHNGFVNIDQEKMSKSLGNFFTIREVLDRFEAEALRYFLLSTHYRSPLNFSDAQLEEAEGRVSYIYETLTRIDDYLQQNQAAEKAEDFGKVFARDDEDYDVKAQFEASLDDDFNTPKVMSVLADMLRLANLLIDAKEKELIGRKLKPAMRAAMLMQWRELMKPIWDVMGLGLQDPAEYLRRVRDRHCAFLQIDQDWVEQMIRDRSEAKAAKDYKKADEIRDRLAEKSISLQDTASGTSWRIG